MLLRDFISVQNRSAFESLRNKGYEIIKNDSLRIELLELYDYHYEILEKLEEDYSAMQFYEHYYKDINDIIHPYLIYDGANLVDMKQPLGLSKNDRQRLNSYFWNLEVNRTQIMTYYDEVNAKLNSLIENINEEIKTRQI